MKFRVVHTNYFPTYFRIRHEAENYQKENGGTIERKIGSEWIK